MRRRAAVGVLALVALAGCGGSPSQEEAEAAVCDSLASLSAAVGDLAGIDADSTVDEAQAARESLDEALADVEDAAADLREADTSALRSGVDALGAAVDDASGDDTLGATASALQAASGGLTSAVEEIRDGVGCGADG